MTLSWAIHIVVAESILRYHAARCAAVGVGSPPQRAVRRQQGPHHRLTLRRRRPTPIAACALGVQLSE
jgi:hypothetical protein